MVEYIIMAELIASYSKLVYCNFIYLVHGIRCWHTHLI